MNNPIVHKEVLTSLRTKKAFWMQAMFFSSQPYLYGCFGRLTVCSP
ncbi:MAG TPA: hypothetical protein PLK08_02655 [Phycisphaerae bacterium]|nr:hypothetical protein [Phycisphaerae bacterium]